MKTLSVKQPWAYLLCTGLKDIENRTWKLPQKYKGERVLIHVGLDKRLNLKALTKEQYNDVCDKFNWDATTVRPVDKWDRGAIIGSVRFVDCVINHQSIWAEKGVIDQMECPKCGCIESRYFGDGEHLCDRCSHTWWENENKPIYNWVVSDPILFDKPILNVKGKLGFWESYHEPIICPNCGRIQCAKVEDTIPFMTYIHECEKCGYTIMESEWDKIK